jgi:aspartyl-tRNA(Asn)/glutamyl-tRNA(Gln) amidotransferase subunit A
VIDATALAGQLAAGSKSSVELTTACLDDIERRNSTLRAFTFVDRAGALAQAAASDARRGHGELAGPADGLPIALKANLAVSGWPHTGGYGFLREVRATADAAVVARLRARGGVFLGMTNMDEGALGATSINPWFGTTVNPRSSGHAVGGSSGGSAAAVVAGQCAFALGTDTLGSVRIPAAWCGVAAFKPTFGVVSLQGVLPVHPRFDHLGVIAPSVRDLRLAFECMLDDQIDHELRPPRPVGAPARIGFARNLDLLQPDRLVLRAYQRALATLRALGHSLVPVDIETWSLAGARRALFALCEIELESRHRERVAREPESYSPALRAQLAFAARQTPADRERFEQRVAALRAHVFAALEGLDALATPTVPATAHPLGGAPADHAADLTSLANATGLPAVSVPLVEPGALAAAVQLVGPAGRDFELIQLAIELDAGLERASAGAGSD